MSKNLIQLTMDPGDLAKFLARLQAVEQQVTAGATEGMEKATEQLLNIAQQSVPRDLGVLKKSAKYRVSNTGTTFMGAVGYGEGGDVGRHKTSVAKYAIYTHEVPRKVAGDGDGYKWLELSLLGFDTEFLKILADAFKSALGR